MEMKMDLTRKLRGSVRVSPKEVATMEIVRPEGVSSRWEGVSHGELLKLVREGADNFGLRIAAEQWEVSPNRAQLAGYLDFACDAQALTIVADRFTARGGEALPRFGDFNPEVVGLRLGVIHSNDLSFAIGLIAALEVKVCRNGLVVGTDGAFLARRKHTTGIHRDLPGLIHTGFLNFLDSAQHAEGIIRTLQGRYLGQAEVHNILCLAAEQGILPWSSLGKVWELYKESPHPEFRENNAWSLLNAFTEVGRELPNLREMRVANRARKLIEGTGHVKMLDIA